MLDYAGRTAPDLRIALQRLTRYNRRVHDLASFEVIPAGDAVRIEHRFGRIGLRPCRHAAESTLASLVVVASLIGGAPVQARDVDFAHPAAGSAEDFRAVFGVPPRFDATSSCLLLAGEVLDRPVPAADPA